MAKYVEKNLGKNETIVKSMERTWLFLLGTWIKGILLFFLIVPLFKAIFATIEYYNVELAITNKRIVGKHGVFNTKTLDAPLNKIQNVSVEQKLFGKIFNYGTIIVNTAAGEFNFHASKAPDAFKRMVMEQIDQYEEDRVKQQASEMANAMAGALKQ